MRLRKGTELVAGRARKVGGFLLPSLMFLLYIRFFAAYLGLLFFYFSKHIINILYTSPAKEYDN